MRDLLTPLRLRALRDGLTLAGLIAVAGIWYLTVSRAEAIDAHAYWVSRPPVTYSALPGTNDAFLYSPAFAQILSPLTALPWEVFLGIWLAAILIPLAAITGPWLLIAALLLTLGEVHYGNIHYLMAAAVLVGFRHPWTWSLMFLTKVTPGVGVLWFAGRREWRKLGVALGATGLIVAVSFAIAPEQWWAWAAFLRQNAATAPTGQLIALPLWVRVVLAAALVLWGGRTDRRWTMPVAVVLALPHGTIGLAVLVALIPILAARWRGSWSALIGRPGRVVAPDRGGYPAAHAPGSAP